MMNETSKADVEKFKDEMLQSIKAENSWKSTMWENLLTFIGLGIVIWATIYLYNTTQVTSKLLQDLAPSRELFESNIDKINALSGLSGIQTTTAFGFLALGMAIMAFGIAWASYRSSNRNTKIIIYTIGLAMEGIMNFASWGVEHIDSRLDSKKNSSVRSKPTASKATKGTDF